MTEKPYFDVHNDIHHQHSQLKSLVEVLRCRFDSQGQVDRSLVSLLRGLADHLQAHFEFEEADEYFSELLRDTPRFEEQVGQLIHEHAVLSEAVEDLVHSAKHQLAIGGSAAELAEQFTRFRDQLLAHESAENALLQEAYTRDVGTKD